jgi:Cytochrome c554 and c-prime
MRRVSASATLLGSLVGSLFGAGVALAAPADYVGEPACSGCHVAAQKAWMASAHARASSPEVLGRQARNGACLSCHATGEGGAAARFLPGVQCEACHGPGVAYAAAEDIMRDPVLARALGLRDLRKDPAAVCARCHRPEVSTRAGKFDYARAWKRVAH